MHPQPSRLEPLPAEPLKAGEVLYWHHLLRSGEIPAVEEDVRARMDAEGQARAEEEEERRWERGAKGRVPVMRGLVAGRRDPETQDLVEDESATTKGKTRRGPYLSVYSSLSLYILCILPLPIPSLPPRRTPPTRQDVRLYTSPWRARIPSPPDGRFAQTIATRPSKPASPPHTDSVRYDP
ncbi:hypothetical protein BN946_scf184871.g8 [Trametes cinnabarina]|uniref:Uncharacterized protein n=1 Tax=Pycnoporus cinnabarinus TaxID=5643 RepID=A0A060SLY0_PYCCI|nr:hypothetical protein BN946_scf184871.g8 [Trametes cinnabarina]